MSSYELAASGSPWLGDVPSNWRVSRFGYEALVNGGQVDPRLEPWRSMILVAPNHIERSTGRIVGRETAAKQGADSGKYLATAGQIIYSKIRPALNKVTIAVEECLCSADMYAMSFRPAIVPRYALYYMLARPFHSYATVTSMRVKMPKINRDELAAAPWLVPPLEEQNSIADFLDRETVQIDALVAKQFEFIGLLQERRANRTADILASLGVPDTQLRRVARIQTGVTLSGDGDPTLPEWPYLRVANVQMGRVDLSEIKTIHLSERDASSSTLQAGDVLMTEGGDIDKLGRGTVWDGLISPMLHQNHVFAVRPTPEVLLPEYLALWLDSPNAREYFYLTAKKTTNLASTNKTIVGQLPIRVPSIEQQKSAIQRHSQEIGRINALIAKAYEHIAFAKERRSALITAAVTGQIDVRPNRKAG